jgi:hypothetical protein
VKFVPQAHSRMSWRKNQRGKTKKEKDIQTNKQTVTKAM